MDAIQDIVRHPFYRPCKRSAADRLKSLSAVWKLEAEITDLIVRYGLTRRVVRPGKDYAHYKECYESRCEDCTKHDTCGPCVCQRVSFKKFKVMQLLDDLERLNGGVGNCVIKLRRWLSR